MMIYPMAMVSKSLLDFRGGAMMPGKSDFLPAHLLQTSTDAVVSSIQAGPLGVLSLTAIASAVLLPLTQVETTYGFTVGYGGSMAALGLVLRHVLLTTNVAMRGWYAYADVLSGALVFYGLRLATFLTIRNCTGMKQRSSSSSSSSSTSPKMARWSRVPFAASLALFYAFLATPVLYALRAPVLEGGGSDWQQAMAWTGTVLACLGVGTETVADAHKFVVKARSQGGSFDGPTGGLYAITRHPNYTGEVLFYVGCFVAGLPSFGKSVVAYVASAMGVIGIGSIMTSATKRLEERQASKYGGNKRFDEWRKNVQWPIFPFVDAK